MLILLFDILFLILFHTPSSYTPRNLWCLLFIMNVCQQEKQEQGSSQGPWCPYQLLHFSSFPKAAETHHCPCVEENDIAED